MNLAVLNQAYRFALKFDDPELILAWILSKSESHSEYRRYVELCEQDGFCYESIEEELNWPTRGFRNLSTFL